MTPQKSDWMGLIIFVQKCSCVIDFHQNNFFDSMSGFSLQNSCSCKEEFYSVFNQKNINSKSMDEYILKEMHSFSTTVNYFWEFSNGTLCSKLHKMIFCSNTFLAVPHTRKLHQRTVSSAFSKGHFSYFRHCSLDSIMSVPNPSFACIPCDIQMKI